MRQITEWQPDVLHLHFVHIPPNVFLARSLSPTIPYCVTIHGGLSPVALRRRRWLKQIFGLTFERRYLEHAASLHAISEEDVEGLRAYGVSNATVLACNGIDLDSFPTSADRSLTDGRDPCLQGRRAFLYLGRLDPAQKGLDLLLQAFAAYKRKRRWCSLARTGGMGSATCRHSQDFWDQRLGRICWAGFWQA